MKTTTAFQRPEGEEATTVPGGEGHPRPQRKVIVGAGMLTPVRDFTWRGELYKAGGTRVAPIADVCRSEYAHLLEPAWDQERDPAVIEVFERATGRRWDPVSPRTSTRTRTPARSTPLYGSPEYYGRRQRRHDDGAAAKAILQHHHASAMVVGPKLEREILASNAKRHVKN